MDRTLISLLSDSQTFESLRFVHQNSENHSLLGSLEEVTSLSLKKEKEPRPHSSSPKTPPAESKTETQVEPKKGFTDTELLNALMKLRDNQTSVSRSSILKGRPHS